MFRMVRMHCKDGGTTLWSLLLGKTVPCYYASLMQKASWARTSCRTFQTSDNKIGCVKQTLPMFIKAFSVSMESARCQTPMEHPLGDRTRCF